MDISDLNSIQIKLASPKDVLKWSYGEVTKSETINYKTQKAEKDGLFCEKIFGPEKNYKCYCGKYKGIKYKGIICDRCGVELTKALVRRERMGHIELAVPVAHIWFLRSAPSRISNILDIPMQQLEKVIYYSAYIIISVDEKAKKEVIKKINIEYQERKKEIIKGAQKEKLEADEKKKQLKELLDFKKKNYNEIASIQPLKIISEIEFYNLSLKYAEIFEIGIGAEAIVEILKKIDLKKLLRNIEKDYADATIIDKKQKLIKKIGMIKGMINAQIRPEWMFLTILPVLPADLRPIVQLDGGKHASSDLNNLYRRVINRNNRLKHFLEISAPEIIVRNEKRMLQEAVDSLLDNQMRKRMSVSASIGGKRLLKSLADMIKGKTGRFRKNLLGKRVDYSGRSVIVGGPTLKLNQVGLPKKMALELFKPFIIKEILEKELAYNLKGAKNLIEDEVDQVWEILEEIIKEKYVLLNRAPTLHRLSIQAFKPILVEGKAIEIHPLICDPFNADFDGDTMAVHLLLSEEAQNEGRDIIAITKNLLKPATGLPIIKPSLDMVLGCYWLTKIIENKEDKNDTSLKTFSNKEEAILSYELKYIDLRKKIRVKIGKEYIETTVGRILFNEILPPGTDFANEEMSSKKIEKLILKIIKNFSNEEVVKALDKIKDIGFEYSTKSAASWGMDDLVIPIDKKKIIKEKEIEIEKNQDFYDGGLISEEENRSKAIQVWTEAKKEIEEAAKKSLPELSSPYYFIASGARGSWGQLIQMVGMKGLVQSATGNIIETPIKGCYKEGLNILEYFISTHGARKGSVSTALQTAVAGYLTRKLIDLSHNVIITENDCQDIEGLTVTKAEADDIGQDFSFKIIGRIALGDIKDGKKIIVKTGEMIGVDQSEKIIQAEKIKEIRIRSPLRCKCLEGLCIKCYGADLSYNKEVTIGAAVGIIAAQSIGEPGTQLTMRVFHTGGVASALDVASGLTRVIEILENRAPKGEAKIVLKDGQVLEIVSKTEKNFIENKSSKKIIRIISKEKVNGESEILEYEVPAEILILVQEGDQVKRGQQLSEGTLNLKDLFELSGKDVVEKYIVKEVQRIYVAQGNVHDKHVEIIVRQMLQYSKIENPGDTVFTKGEIIENVQLTKTNIGLKDNKNKATASPVLLGITQATLSANSFLSAASFQETSRVLIKASLEGKVDPLRGIKENVILGKLIPVGTGFKPRIDN